MDSRFEGWKNKGGTGGRECGCGSWKQHWINCSGRTWPSECSVRGCTEAPTLGAHVWHPQVSGEYIIPACDAHNHTSEKLDLKSTTVFVSANKQKTCDA